MRSNVDQICKYDALIIRRDKIYQKMLILFIRKFLRNIKDQSNYKNTWCDMALVGIINIKEIDNFKPFLKIGSADKDQMDSFALTMARRKSTNIAIRRISSSKSDHFLVRAHFDENNEFLLHRQITFLPWLKIYSTRELLAKNTPSFLKNPHPLVETVESSKLKVPHYMRWDVWSVSSQALA